MANGDGGCLAVIIVTVVLLIAGTVGGFFWTAYQNNLANTETRARDNMEKFVFDNSLAPTRKTCAGDSDADGMSSCTLALEGGEKVFLQCPSSYWDVEWFGAKGCKEMSGAVKGGGVVVN